MKKHSNKRLKTHILELSNLPNLSEEQIQQYCKDNNISLAMSKRIIIGYAKYSKYEFFL